MKNRRDFIKTTSILTAGSLIIPQYACKSKKKPASQEIQDITEILGLQIYSLRDQIDEDLEGTLQKVAEIGYKNIEGYGYGDRMILGKTPSEFQKIIHDLGMKLPSMHVVTELTTEESRASILDQWKVTVEDMASINVLYTVYAILPEEERQNLDDFKKWAERFNQFGEICQQAGQQFAYHNHDFEFKVIDEQMGYDILLKETDPELVQFELDMYWITKGGQDPVAYLEKAPGRYELWHLKDMEDSEEKSFAEVGYGTIDFEKIFAKRETAGMKMCFVEQDESKRDMFESIKMSYEYLTKADFV
jgi:sugar phosphate isomerase/epimerase